MTFHKDAHEKYDAKARKAGERILKERDYQDIRDNPDPFGPDKEIYNPDGTFNSYMECEVKEGWKNSEFPFSTVHIPGRKAKYLNWTPPVNGKPGHLAGSGEPIAKITFCVLNESCTKAVLVGGSVVAKSPIVPVRNWRTPNGEPMFDIDFPQQGIEIV
jgi:hypothetical protein